MKRSLASDRFESPRPGNAGSSTRYGSPEGKRIGIGLLSALILSFALLNPACATAQTVKKTVPVNGAIKIAPDTKISIHLTNLPRCGEPGITVSVYDECGALPGSFSYAVLPRNECQITFAPHNPFPNNRRINWSVRAASRQPRAAARFEKSFSFSTSACAVVLDPARPRKLPDSDCDGIPDAMELDVMKTNPSLKTLFVKPAVSSTLGATQFSNLLSYARVSGKLTVRDIFRNKGIEIVVIGDSNNPYEPMRSVSYDPVVDDPGKPISILNFKFSKYDSNDPYEGHTNLASSADGFVWSWGTMGFTISGSSSPAGYHTPATYVDPRNFYFVEGAYDALERGQTAISTNCKERSCDRAFSPLNSKIDRPNPSTPGVLLGKYPVLNSAGELGDTSEGWAWDRNEVHARVIAHELGHALLNACCVSDTESDTDHCVNPGCIMYGHVLYGPEGWDLKDFGGGSHTCIHRKCHRGDIGAKGIVDNRDPQKP